MFNRLLFAFSYALRNLRRDRQRTFFALFSIAAGVATVVALRMLGLMLTDALTENIRATMRGDIVAQSLSGPRISFIDTGNQGPGAQRLPFTKDNASRIAAWAEANNAQITLVTTGELTQAAVVKDERAGAPSFLIANFIDPQAYPFYDTIRAADPAGVLLKDLFKGQDQVVIGQRVANQIGAKVGDTIRLGTAPRLQTVVGIVPDTVESPLNNPNGALSALFSFAYVDRQYSADFSLDPQSADRAFIKLPAGSDLKQIKSTIATAWGLPTTGRRVNIVTVDEQLQQNQIASDLVSRFVLLLSLIALVIGGVGIVNTMLVAVNRRANEIAVMKTLGLKRGGIFSIFLSESLMIGLMGSLVGVVIGFGLSLIAQRFGEEAFGFPLPWRFHVDPILLGVGMGLLITAIFSVLPILAAAQVRPALVLRQSGLSIIRAGFFQSLISLLVLIVGLGTLIDLIIGNPFATLSVSGARGAGARALQRLPTFQFPFTPGILTVIGVFIAFALILGLSWIVVWLLGKLPSFRNPNLRLAIRGLTMYRGRTALSLLALVVGMTALSSTLIMTRSINQLLYTTLSGPLGGNVIVLPLLPLTGGFVRGRLDSTTGVRGYREIRFGDTRLMSVNGDANFRTKLTNLDADGIGSNLLDAKLSNLLGVRVYGAPSRSSLIAGRMLTSEDVGKPVMTIPYDTLLDAMGIAVGSTFTYRLNGKIVNFEVVGIVAPDWNSSLIPIGFGDSAAQAPIDMVPALAPFDLIIADVAAEQVRDALAAAGAVPGTFVFDIGVLDSVLNRLFSQLAALPLLVAGLSLFAATVLIATTVSLATLERRRQIGILKALGVKRGETLWQLLVENGIVGLTGGIIAVLPTFLVLASVPLLTQNLVTLPIPWDLIGGMLVLSTVIALGATMLTAWGASGEKPLTVLRYE